VEFLCDLANVLDDFLAGNINQADARLRLLKSLDEQGYYPLTGFALQAGFVPPAVKGSLRDFSSAKRLNLILETQESLVYGAARKKSGLDALDIEPAWELIRTQYSAVPRGFRKTAVGLIPVPGASWQERWTTCGGTLFEGERMIALKTDPIWGMIGDSATFPDALDVDYPPFAFNSGYSWVGMSREECDELGIDYSGQREPEDDESLTGEPPKMGAKKVPPDLRLSVADFLDADIEGDTFIADLDTQTVSLPGGEDDQTTAAPLADTVDTAGATPKAVLDFEKEHMRDAYETALVTRRDGTVIFEKEGLFDNIRFTPDELARMKDSIATHNHPSGGTFSVDDVKAAIQQDIYQTRAFGEYQRHGKKYLYTLTREGEFSRDLWARADKDLRAIREAVIDEMNAAVEAETISYKESRFQIPHEVWKRLAAKYSEYFTYERTEITEGGAA